MPNGEIINLLGDALFPKVSTALIKQAKVFTGKEIVVDPHWRAAPSLWLDENGEDSYRDWLKDIQKEKDSVGAAFLFHREGLGVYIVYADHVKRWDGELRTDPQNDRQIDCLCHEVGHMLTTFSAENMSLSEVAYFSEQSAILAANMQKTAVGNKGTIYRPFPLLKAFQPMNIQQTMPYEHFSIYTPSPLARFYETNRGHREGAARYLSPSGIVRFDLVADDVAEAALHFRLHLSAMEIFGKIAGRIDHDASYANYISKNILRFRHCYPRFYANLRSLTLTALCLSDILESLRPVRRWFAHNSEMHDAWRGMDIYFGNVEFIKKCA